MADYKEFNINSQVKVLLNDDGYKCLYEYWHKSDITFGEMLFPDITIDSLKAKADNDGYSIFQCWQFMAIFGPHLEIHKPTMFGTNILLKEFDLKDIINH